MRYFRRRGANAEKLGANEIGFVSVFLALCCSSTEKRETSCGFQRAKEEELKLNLSFTKKRLKKITKYSCNHAV